MKAIRPMRPRDFWAGIMFCTIGVFFAVGALDYRLGQSARPGPGYFPLGLGVLLALFGVVVIVQALRSRERGDAVGRFAWRPLLVTLASIVVFGAALPRLGLVLTLPLLVAMISLAGDEFRWRDVALGSAVLTVGSWAVFILGLGLVIPVWPTFLAN